MSMEELLLTAHKMLPPRNTALAAKMTGILPKMSESLPQKGTDEAFAKR
jgi:hypothetical protein